MSYSTFKVLPKPQGPLPTGCLDIMFGRTSQDTLMRLYYPTSKEEGSESNLASWSPGNEYSKGMAKFVLPTMPYLIETLFHWNTKDTKIPSLVEAPLATGSFPLILFSHGLSAHRNMYSTICNDLASHGFAVAAIEHRDESASATFTLSDSGEKVWTHYRLPTKGVKEFPLRNSQVKIRASECSRALDMLEGLSQGEITQNELPSTLPLTAFKGKIDLSHPVLAGHSFGGATTIYALAKDKRFRLGLALDPWMFPLKEDLGTLPSEVTQPLLVLLTETFKEEVSLKAFSAFDLERNTFVTLKGSVHQNQSDTPFLFGFMGRAIGGAWSSLDRHLALALNNKLMINFICRNLGLRNIGPKVLNVSESLQHLLLGLQFEEASFESVQELLNFQTNNNNNNSHSSSTKNFNISSRL